jgi:hypothetical protein
LDKHESKGLDVYNSGQGSDTWVLHAIPKGHNIKDYTDEMSAPDGAERIGKNHELRSIEASEPADILEKIYARAGANR